MKVRGVSDSDTTCLGPYAERKGAKDVTSTLPRPSYLGPPGRSVRPADATDETHRGTQGSLLFHVLLATTPFLLGLPEPLKNHDVHVPLLGSSGSRETWGAEWTTPAGTPTGCGRSDVTRSLSLAPVYRRGGTVIHQEGDPYRHRVEERNTPTVSLT